MDIREIAIGETVECELCGETLVRVNDDEEGRQDFREVASGNDHECWTQLPNGVEHIRLD